MLDMRYQLSSIISYHPLSKQALVHIISSLVVLIASKSSKLIVFEAFRRYPPEKFIALVESHGIKCAVVVSDRLGLLGVPWVSPLGPSQVVQLLFEVPRKEAGATLLQQIRAADCGHASAGVVPR